jgi:hypothetical protein
MPATARPVFATLALASALMLGATAQAAPTSITYTSKFAVFHNTTTGELVSAQRQQEGSSSAFSLEAFDGSLGTLLAVDLSYNARWTYNANVMGFASIGGCGAACTRRPADADIGVQGNHSALFALFMTGNGEPQAVWQRNVSSNTLACEATAPAEASCEAWSVSRGTAIGSVDGGSPSLARFIQQESRQQIDFTARTTATTDIQNCNLGTRQAIQYCLGQSAGWLNGTFSITYTYEAAQQAVPLPSTLALLLAAGGLLAWQRRRAA